MKRKISILIVLLILTIFTINVQAANTTSSFESESSIIKAGDTVVITLSLTNSSAINGLTTALKFDSNVFEYQSVTLQDTTNYSLLGSTADDIAVIAATETGSTTLSLDITLKVKEGATTGSTTVSTDNIVVDLLNEEAGETLAAKSVSFTVAENIIIQPDQNTNTETPIPSDGETPTNTTTSTPQQTTPSNTSGKDTTTQTSKIPQTGDENIIIIAIVAVMAVFGIVSYIKYKKYKNI